MTYFGIFKLEFEKPLSYLKSAPLNLSKCKAKERKFKFEVKNFLFAEAATGGVLQKKVFTGKHL